MSKLTKKLDACINLIGGIAFLMIILFVLANVISDWTRGRRYAQFDEIVNTFFVWVTYVGMGSLYRSGEQIHVDFLVEHLPGKIRAAADIFVDIVTLGISAVMLYLAWNLSMKSFVKTTSVLKIPFAIIDFALVVGFFTMILYIVVKYVEKVQKGGNKVG